MKIHGHCWKAPGMRSFGFSHYFRYKFYKKRGQPGHTVSDYPQKNFETIKK